jgi:two-component system sensor histidine kinase SenX3
VNNIQILIIGFCAGAAVAWLALFLFTREKKQEVQVPNSVALKTSPADAVAFLEVLSVAGVVLDRLNNVVANTLHAAEIGIVEYGKLTSEELKDFVSKARIARETLTEEVSFSRNQRTARIELSARATAMDDDFIILVVEDRTEAKRLEETRRDFVENISHELKTPISSISLLSEALQVAVDNPEQVKKFAKNLQRESKRLGSLVKEIIQLSRIQGGDLAASVEPVELSTVISEAVDLNQFLADSKNIKLTVNAPDGLVVLGDSELLTMALKNLIENAVVYSNADTQVGIGLREVDGFAEITVTDNGLGIPLDQQERIFERFYRVDPSRSRETGGTGLGLSIVKHAAINHGGDVNVFSRVGLGSTFTLRIPLYMETEDSSGEDE